MPTDYIGSYELISIDGKDLPAIVDHQGVDIQVLSGEFHINSDWTCSSRTVFVSPTAGELIRLAHATYTLAGSTLVMAWVGAGQTDGIVDGDTFTMDNEGTVFVYSKLE